MAPQSGCAAYVWDVNSSLRGHIFAPVEIYSALS
jgi:hypothetical protein